MPLPAGVSLSWGTPKGGKGEGLSTDRTDQCRRQFLDAVAETIDYWDRPGIVGPDGGPADQKWRLHGVAFSLLVMLDGCNAGVPGFIVQPNTAGTEWADEWPPDVDIAGGLHEHLAAAVRARLKPASVQPAPDRPGGS